MMRFITSLKKHFVQLPRESQDSLFLIAVISCVLIPHFSHLPSWAPVYTSVLLAWRAILAWRGRNMPHRAWLMVLLALAVGGTWWSFKTLVGKDAGVTLIVILLALKTLEAKAKRDAYVIFFLSFFCMLSQFLYSQSLLTALSMTVAFVGLLSALVQAHMPVGNVSWRHTSGIALRMMLLGSPIMLTLFMVFPRIAPLWGMPNLAASGKTGLSSEMRVGTIASLAQDDSIAMRIRFQGPVVEQSQAYFRGPVLDFLNEQTWSSLPLEVAINHNAPTNNSQQLMEVSEPALRYEVTLEPQNKPWLMVFDATVVAPALANYQVTPTPYLQWLADRPINELIRYKAVSYSQYRYGPTAPNAYLQSQIALPEGLNPRTIEWAFETRKNPQYAQATAQELSQMLLQHLNTKGYAYTLEPGEFGPNTSDEFWFDKKQGFCEHIASSFVIMMRALGVPARVVTGYQGGAINPNDGFWEVRQSDAHAWAEIWQKPDEKGNGGWVRVDPTSAVAPDRVASQNRLATKPNPISGAVNNLLGPSLSTSLLDWGKKLALQWSALNNVWNQNVLNYSQNQQFNFLKKLGFSQPNWQDLSFVVSGLILITLIGFTIFHYWQGKQHDPWLKMFEKSKRFTQLAGLSSSAESSQTTPRALALLWQQRYKNQAQPEIKSIIEFLMALEQQRYGVASSTSNKTAIKKLQGQLKKIKWPKS